MRIVRSPLLIIMLASILAGCSTTRPWVPVGTAGEHGQYYIVRHGDTLYSIAFRYGLDYRALARTNGIGPPYTIYVDQRLRLAGVAPAHKTDSGPVTATRPSPPLKETVTSRNDKPAQVIVAPRIADGDIAWRWPHEGDVVSTFSLSGKINKGIDIQGKVGDPVRAAAAGVVVYAGGGLRGYGKLVIVKHNDNYLSAYGHADSILVKEGEKVRSGETLAKMGSARDTSVLHFEIRRDGKPEDPLGFLPSRGR